VRIPLVASALVCALGCASETIEPDKMDGDFFLLAPGAPSPPVRGKDARGEESAPVTSGSPTLVHFYSSWKDCAGEIRWLATLNKAYGPSGLKVVGVASVPEADRAEWKVYLENKGALDWANVADTQGRISKEWHRRRTKTGSHSSLAIFYLVGGGKILQGDVIGPDGGTLFLADKLKEIFPNVAVPK
jgi:hypothetical protein